MKRIITSGVHKRHLENGFTCDREECVKKNCNGDAHDDKCKMEDLRYLLSDDWDCLSLPMNKKDIRKEYHSDMDRLINARNMWGMLWAEELYRLRCVDVKAYAYQSALLSCDWNRDTLETNGMLMDNLVEERSDGLRQRLVDRGLRSLSQEMDFACRIVNAELKKRGGTKDTLRNRHMSLEAFHNIICSSEATNDKYMWQNQLIKIYDVKHGWMHDKLPTKSKDILDQGCPKFQKGVTNACRSCDVDRWNEEDPSKRCDEKRCMLCQGPKAKRNRSDFWDKSESLGRIHSYSDELLIHPAEEHLVSNWNEDSQRFAGWFVSVRGTCRHDRYTRCRCYRKKAANYGMLKDFNEQDEKPCIELHNYNFGWNMSFQAYSSKVGLGNTPVRFTGELVRPYDPTVEPKDEVRLLKDRLRVNQPFGWGRSIWDRWLEISPRRPTPTGELQNYPHWNPAVSWNVEGPRLSGHAYSQSYSREDYYRYLPTKRPNPYLNQVAYSIDSTKDFNAYLDSPRWIDNTEYWAWDSPYDECMVCSPPKSLKSHVTTP